jgi:hypothetical protein
MLYTAGGEQVFVVMASNISDHWLWLGLGTFSPFSPLLPTNQALGAFTFIAVQQVSQGLQHIRALTEIRNPEHIPAQRRTIPSGPVVAHHEDAIKTSSLLTLATSHNTEIRSSATKILCTRFYASKSAKNLLIKDLYSRDEEVVRRARLAFNLLCEMGVWRESSLPPRPQRGGWRLLERQGGHEGSGGSEQDVRRRRREAMVIHDGEGAIGGDDVFMQSQEGGIDSDDIRVEIEERGTVEE